MVQFDLFVVSNIPSLQRAYTGSGFKLDNEIDCTFSTACDAI
jgi:hypothetical protein